MKGWTRQQYAVDLEEMNLFVEDEDRETFNKIVNEYMSKISKNPMWLCQFAYRAKKQLTVELHSKLMELRYKQ